MRHVSPHGLLAGFSVDRPSPEVAELVAVGDQWAPAHRLMGWHTHLEWELYLQFAGTTLRRSDAGSCEMAPGSLFIAPPGVRHRVVNQGAGSEHNGFVRFRLDPVLRRLRALAPLWRRATCAHVRDAWALEPPFRQLVREVTLEQPFRVEGLRQALDGVVIAAARLLGPEQPRVLVAVPEAVQEVRELLERSCEKPWTLRQLAEAARVSPSHLLALFRRHLGIAPHRYLLRQRVERARHLLLHSDAPITAIALEVGFGSSQHFAKAFKAIAGRSAREYRAQARV